MPEAGAEMNETTARERYVKTLNFDQPDRIFYSFGAPRKSTIDAWYLQGLPQMSAADDYGFPDELYDFVGHGAALDPTCRNERLAPF